MKLVTTCVTLLAVFALAACGGSAVAKDDVEKQASDLIEKDAGEKPKSVTCPEDLDAEKGAKMKCELVAPDDTKYDLEVVVTSVENDTAKFSVEVLE